jgi:hypothetical protein
MHRQHQTAAQPDRHGTSAAVEILIDVRQRSVMTDTRYRLVG